MQKGTKISCVVPFHWMKEWQFYLTRCLESIERQTYKDYEVILVKHSDMPTTSNRAMQAATGELIKVLYMDDFLAHDNALKEIAEHFPVDAQWLVTGCLHQTRTGRPERPHYPQYTDDISTGNNCIGSPSVLTLRNDGKLLFDEKLSWLLDCDLYKRLHDTYGPPVLLSDLNVVIGQGDQQMTHILTDERKLSEHRYLNEKHV